MAKRRNTPQRRHVDPEASTPLAPLPPYSDAEYARLEAGIASAKTARAQIGKDRRRLARRAKREWQQQGD